MMYLYKKKILKSVFERFGTRGIYTNVLTNRLKRSKLGHVHYAFVTLPPFKNCIIFKENNINWTNRDESMTCGYLG